MTLDSSQLYATSRLRYGQIKSLELQQHQHCWYRLVPEPGYRIELQIYRLVDTGHLNQSKYFIDIVDSLLLYNAASVGHCRRVFVFIRFCLSRLGV